MFSVVSDLAGALLNLEAVQSSVMQKKGLFERIWGNQADYFTANHPFTLLEKNADQIRGQILLRIVVGKDKTTKYNNEFHTLLGQLKIEHEFIPVDGVGHSYQKLCETVGMDRMFAFFKKAFEKVYQQSAAGNLYLRHSTQRNASLMTRTSHFHALSRGGSAP